MNATTVNERNPMGSKAKTAITPTRADDYPEWDQQVIKASDLAERSPVRGCMVIKPWGYALWENIVRVMDDMFKATGVKNAYFPLFIPLNVYTLYNEDVPRSLCHRNHSNSTYYSY